MTPPDTNTGNRIEQLEKEASDFTEALSIIADADVDCDEDTAQCILREIRQVACRALRRNDVE